MRINQFMRALKYELHRQLRIMREKIELMGRNYIFPVSFAQPLLDTRKRANIWVPNPLLITKAVILQTPQSKGMEFSCHKQKKR